MTTETYVDKPWGDQFPAFASIDFADAYEGYEWDQFHVIRGRDGYLYTGEGNGCSCFDFWTDLEAPQRARSWIEVAERIKEWIGSQEAWNDRESAGMQLIERLTNTKPAAHIDIDDPKWPVIR